MKYTPLFLSIHYNHDTLSLLFPFVSSSLSMPSSSLPSSSLSSSLAVVGVVIAAGKGAADIAVVIVVVIEAVDTEVSTVTKIEVIMTNITEEEGEVERGSGEEVVEVGGIAQIAETEDETLSCRTDTMQERGLTIDRMGRGNQGKWEFLSFLRRERRPSWRSLRGQVMTWGILMTDPG
mmetsp:Transcript_10592/g.10664  ORF Transcript_10592/g.10664 Transcript_10592/m.10664 type:complete len:178 (-) Transcript_10592:375-908(-)